MAVTRILHSKFAILHFLSAQLSVGAAEPPPTGRRAPPRSVVPHRLGQHAADVVGLDRDPFAGAFRPDEENRVQHLLEDRPERARAELLPQRGVGDLEQRIVVTPEDVRRVTASPA